MLLDEFIALLNRILRRFPNLNFPDVLKQLIFRFYLQLEFLRVNDLLQRQKWLHNRFHEDDSVARGRPRREGPGF